MTAPPGRRFTVSAARIPMRWMGLLLPVWIAVIIGAVLAVQALLPEAAARNAVGAVILVSVIGYGAFLVFAMSPKKVAVDVVPAPDRLVVDEGRGGTFPLAGALAGPWTVPSYGTTQGTALHLTDGHRHWRLGGRDHRPAATLRLDAPPVQSVDAYLPAADFDALLALLPAPWAAVNRDPMRAAGGPQPVRCSLVPNRASGKATFAMMLPWILTIVAVMALSGIGGALGLLESATGMYVFGTLTCVLVVAGLAVTVVRGMRTPQPALVIEVDARELRVVDLKTSRLVAAAPIAHVGASPARHVYGGRTSYTMPVLVVLVPGSKPLTIGIPDLRFSWNARGKVQDYGSPAYVVGGADWLTLVERLGAAPHLEVGPG